MSSRRRLTKLTTAYSLLAALVLALGGTMACGDDDDDNGGDNAGGSDEGGSSGNAGRPTGGNGGNGANAGDGVGGGASGGESGAETGGSGGEAGGGGAPAFWDDGVQGVELDPENDDRLWSVAFGPDNEIYAVGYLATATGDRQMAVAKYTTDGELDESFDEDGLAVFNHSTYAGTADDPTTMANEADAPVEEARDIVVQSDGKLVIVGRAEDPLAAAPTRETLSDLVFFRLNDDGSLDESFGTVGRTIVSFGGTPEDQVWGLDIDGDDRVYAFGSGLAPAATTRTDSDRYVVRLTADGELDPDWGTEGLATFDTPQGTLETPTSPTLRLNDNQRHGFVTPDGSVISSGYTNVAGRNQVVLAKFSADGVLDTEFSGDGVARVAPFPNGMAEAYGVAVQANGNAVTGFVTTGYGRVDVDSTTATDLDLVSFRFNADGGFDTTWGVSGAVVHDTASAEDRGRYTLALADNRVLMFGTAVATGTNKDAMILLLEENGAPAANFSPSGSKLYDFGGDNDEFYAAAVSPDGAWLVAIGYAGAAGALDNGNATFVILPIGE